MGWEDDGREGREGILRGKKEPGERVRGKVAWASGGGKGSLIHGR